MCDYCKKEKPIESKHGNFHIENTLLIESTPEKYFIYEIKYCPFCGEKLTEGKRTKGQCKYCLNQSRCFTHEGSFSNGYFQVFAEDNLLRFEEGELVSNSIEIEFCPMCGSKLTSQHIESLL